MRHIIFQENNAGYKIAILVKETALRETQIREYYINPLKARGVPTDSIIAFSLMYGVNGKAPVTLQREYLNDLLPALKEQGVEYLFVTDTAYFKTLTNSRKAEPHYGYILPCSIDGYTDFKIIFSPSYTAIFYNPKLQDQVDLSLETLVKGLNGTYQKLGKNVIHSHKYVRDSNEVYTWLNNLKYYPELTCDVETLSLQFWKTGIVTIGFAWDKNNGITLWIDDYAIAHEKNRRTLKDFFYSYTGTLIYHNANFDMKILVNTLFMEHLLDEEGKQTGVEVLCRSFHDTKLIAYLATNSTAGNKLSLKDLAQEYLGNYAQSDIKDITKISREVLEEYNLLDALGTWYVFDKYFPKMMADNQFQIYETIFKPSVKVILQMELTGMPVDITKVAVARSKLEADIKRVMDIFNKSLPIQEIIHDLREKTMNEKNATLVTKVKPIEDFEHIVFNPNSNDHLIAVFYDYYALPIIETTKGGQPSCAGDTFKSLLNHAEDPECKELLQCVMDYLDASKILGTFVSAFEKSVLKSDGWHYLHGNFNLGGTVSGRLSSSGPNMQNIPSTGSKYAKIIKECFAPPPGWLFMGADFASLEDRVSALTTRDKNKLKVYVDGYDGHCLRAFYYFPDRLTGIVDTVEGINSIKKLFPEVRQDSKEPTFLLTYGGTYFGLMKNVGLSKEVALSIEDNYHKLYVESDEWVQAKLDKASEVGYLTVAFGLRVRTPLLHQCFMNSSKTLYEAKSESRTGGNALGQSYGMLNNRAAIDLQERLFDTDYRYDILPAAHIHDAQYFLVRDNTDVVSWLNINLAECMAWQDLPELEHDVVKLGGELSLFFPSWKNEHEIPNGFTQDEIKTVIKKSIKEKS
jgi:DNA polymerase-1